MQKVTNLLICYVVTVFIVALAEGVLDKVTKSGLAIRSVVMVVTGQG